MANVAAMNGAGCPPVGYQHWRRLLFIHWPISPEILRPLVPPTLRIDEYDSRAWITLATFVVHAARPLGAPRFLGLDFLETNVRTYVKLPAGEPGVYFFSLDAASVVATIGARAALGLPYFWSEGNEWVSGSDIAYTLRRRSSTAYCRVRYHVGEYRGPAVAGTLDHFLIERYLLHVQRGPTLWSVRVRHRAYPLYTVQVNYLEETLVHAAGIPRVGSQPQAHFASGVDVAVYPPTVRLAAAVE